MSFHNLATGLRLLGGDGGISANEACEHTTQSLLRGSSWKGTNRDLTGSLSPRGPWPYHSSLADRISRKNSIAMENPQNSSRHEMLHLLSKRSSI